MATLSKLTPEQHQNLKLKDTAVLDYAKKLHMIQLRASEIPRVTNSLPVFFSRNEQTGEWALSAITCFRPGNNLFISGDRLDTLYSPLALRTYPLYLMKADNEKGYTPGIVEDSDAFTTEDGEPLFTDNGQASLMLDEKLKLLESTIKEDIQTYQFINKVEELGLIKPVDLMITSQEQGSQALKGLQTVDEDALQKLSGAQLEELNKAGYLVPIHAMLISIFQINALVQRHNANGSFDHIQQVKLEIARDRSLA